MPHSLLSQLRRWLCRTHLLAGLLIGVFALVLGVSGALLLFRPQIERSQTANNPPSTISTPASLDSLYAAIKQRRPSARLVSVILPAQDTNDPLQFAVAENGPPTRVAVDPQTGNELPARAQSAWLAWTVRLHHTLFAQGHFYTGIVGAVLCYLCLSGLIIWWPGLRRLKLSSPFAPHRLKSLRARELHIAIGVWSLVGLLVLAFTGTVFTWREQYTKAAVAVSRSAYAPPKPRVPGDARTLSLDSAVRAASVAVPNATPTLLRVPSKPGEPFIVRLRADSDLPRMGAHQVFLGPDATVLAVDRPSDRPFAVRVVDALGPVHFADVGGWPLRILWMFIGFAPAVLFLSGLRLWYRKVLKPAFAPAASRRPGRKPVPAADIYTPGD